MTDPGAATGTTVVLATRNAGKVRELRELTAAVSGLRIVPVTDFAGVEDVVESGTSFDANATLKAVTVAEATGLPAIADDSGLCVDVLHGCPGIFSARWAGRHGDDEANIYLLLAQVADLPDAELTAHFHCTVALARPGGAVTLRHGRWDGRLARARRGAAGFGYDPILELPDGRTVAELDPAEKNESSHRARAFVELLPDLADLSREIR